MDARLLYPTKFISAAELKDKDVTLTVRHLVMEEIARQGGGKERKPVMYFVETLAAATKQNEPENEKRLVLNKTNAKTVIKLLGHETDAWKGKKIVLFPTQCEAFGEIVDCIRVRDVLPPQTETKTKED